MLFEFTKEKPTPSSTWKAIDKTNLSNLTKAHIWLATLCTADFKQFKSTAQQVESGAISESAFNQSVTSNLKSHYNITLSTPSNLLDDVYIASTFADSKLGLPLLILWQLIAQSNDQADINKLLDTIKVVPTSAQMSELLTLRATQSGDYEVIQPLALHHMPDEVLFSDDNFRRFFPAGFEGTHYVGSTSEIKPYLRKKLMQAVQSGANSFPTPLFKLDDMSF